MTTELEPPVWRQWKAYPELLPGWDTRYLDWLADAAKRGHEFGQHDCVLFPAGAVEAQTGRDFADGHRGRYRSGRGAARYLKALGFASAAALLDSILPPISPAFAQRGDIVLWDGIPGVCIGGEALFLVHGSAEPLRLARALWSRAWAVGRAG